MRIGLLAAFRSHDGRLLAQAVAVLMALAAVLGAFAPAAAAPAPAGIHCLTGDDPAAPPVGVAHQACCLLGCLGAPLLGADAPRLPPSPAVAPAAAPAASSAVAAPPVRLPGEGPRGPPASA